MRALPKMDHTVFARMNYVVGDRCGRLAQAP